MELTVGFAVDMLVVFFIPSIVDKQQLIVILALFTLKSWYFPLLSIANKCMDFLESNFWEISLKQSQKLLQLY